MGLLDIVDLMGMVPAELPGTPADVPAAAAA
jgi:hypothetical protein